MCKLKLELDSMKLDNPIFPEYIIWILCHKLNLSLDICILLRNMILPHSKGQEKSDKNQTIL